MNLVVGATGLLGSEICRLLTAGGKPVKALVRSTADNAKVEKLKSFGVSFTQGDLKDRSSLDAACQGVTGIISTASSTLSRQEGDSIRTVDLEGQMNLIDAAKSAGVHHFTFISFRDNPYIRYPLTIAKRKVEQHLKDSSMSYTSLQVSWFMEVWLSPALGFDFVNANAKVYGAGLNKISWISFLDAAKFAVASLDNPAAHNAIIEVGGPEALSPLEVVKIFEDISGKQFSVQHVPEEALKSQKESAPDPLQESIAGLMLQYTNGDEIDMKETLKAFPLQLTTVRSYARRVLATS
jgi:NADH dehydrogenase